MPALRVVVIDDDQVHLNLMERALQREHVDVLVIKSEIGSVTNRAREFKPDVVLVDLCMPHMPGDELIRLMKREIPTAKYIVLSGCSEPTLLRRAQFDTGADLALLKSTKLEQIIHHIKSFDRTREDD